MRNAPVAELKKLRRALKAKIERREGAILLARDEIRELQQQIVFINRELSTMTPKVGQ